MVGRDITPTEIGKHSKLIKAAQEEMSTIDVLVCGRCLSVFHFNEDFKQHKQKPCQKENNNVRECNDTKPKIWAFLLWKAAQLNNNKETNTTSPNSWALYQTWVKMDESLRETWIVAGKTIQSFAKVGQGGLQEMPVKITKTVVNNSGDGVSAGRKPLTQTKPQVANLKPPVKVPNAAARGGQDSENETSPNKMSTGATSTPMQKILKKPLNVAGAQIQGKTPATPISATGGANVSKTLSRRAKRTVPNSDDIVEENVEKIVAKRFNPRRKMHEYLVKWEARTHEQNTWEPASNLENVPHLLDTFEKQLARQKETRAALQAKQQAATIAAAVKTVDLNKQTDIVRKDGLKGMTPTPRSDASSADAAKQQANLTAAAIAESANARPSRTSKTKAMDQVKQWVSGTNTSSSAAVSPSSALSDASGTPAADAAADKMDWAMHTNSNSIGGSANSSNGAMLAGVKRKLDDSDYNDSNASDLPPTTMSTMEDLEEDLIPSHTVKRMKNGNAISVEVKTKNEKQIESKVFKMNGTTSRNTSVSGESIPVGPNSAEVIITQDTNASGVVKKPGFNGTSNSSQKTEAQIRVLSKGEIPVSSTGIVRLSGGGGGGSAGGIGENTNSVQETPPKVLQGRPQQVRVGATGGRQTPSATVGNTQITTITQRQHIARTPGGTTIQRKTITTPAAGAQQRTTTQSLQGRSTALHQQQTSPSSGRMIIPRQNTAITRPTTTSSKNVTPEQKILQLSKSGDLKVTKKCMTPQQQRQHQLVRQQQQQQQSQVQIQKVQQIAPPTSRNTASVTVRKHSEVAFNHDDHQAQLCPITGKILGQEDPPPQQQQQQVHQLQSGVLQTHLITEQQQQQQQLALQHEQQQQQQLQDIDPTLLLTGDQQMLTNEDGTPLLVTGEDGTVYQVAGKNAEGQTILVTQGPDGEQQFAYVAAADGDDSQVLTLDNAVAEAVAQLQPEQQSEALTAGEGQYLVKTTQEDGTTQMVTMTESELAQYQALAQQQQQQQVAAGGGGVTGQLCIQTGDGSDGQEANIPAEVVQAGLPSPGGTRRVVLRIQDGTFMMTEMHDDEFKALNIAA